LNAEQRESSFTLCIVPAGSFIVFSYELAWIAEGVDERSAAELFLDGRRHEISDRVPRTTKSEERETYVWHGITADISVDHIEKELIERLEIRINALEVHIPDNPIALRIRCKGRDVGRTRAR